MKHDVPALRILATAEDPSALLGNPWADLELPPAPRPLPRAGAWPFQLTVARQLALVKAHA